MELVFRISVSVFTQVAGKNGNRILGGSETVLISGNYRFRILKEKK